MLSVCLISDIAGFMLRLVYIYAKTCNSIANTQDLCLLCIEPSPFILNADGMNPNNQHFLIYSRYIAVRGVQGMVPRYKWEHDISGGWHQVTKDAIFIDVPRFIHIHTFINDPSINLSTQICSKTV